MTRQGHAELVSASFSLIHATVESFFPLCHLDEAAEYLIVCMNAPPGKGPTLRNNNFRDQDSNYANSSFNYHLAQSGCPPPLSMWRGARRHCQPQTGCWGEVDENYEVLRYVAPPPLNLSS